ncbi:phospholipase D-like domain-containing protein [Pseudomonas graminis]|uniref:PLD-like domain-containing protein n=1 Tax=Pseudomonas graminis TaxID=158627 RepID=A0A1I0H9R3_9PSED|nr:phospholipase D family protein [Pseudomonas graminis]SET80464.1 PLD-like domain-containing protein [Pseudomonas graminis]
MNHSSIYTNSPGQDQVLRPYTRLMASASHIRLAAPYFTRANEIVEAVRRGAKVELLVGLNASTQPDALKQLLTAGKCSIRYFTDDFHAKIFLFDGVAMLGSSNLTGGGLINNREAVILLDQPGDEERVHDVEQFFIEVWDSAEVLTQQVYQQFKDVWNHSSRAIRHDPFNNLKAVVPATVMVGSAHKTGQQLYLGELQKTIYEQYLPAFEEVSAILVDQRYRRPEFIGVPVRIETNRFLNWVRLEHAIGDEAWQKAAVRTPEDRKRLIMDLGGKWTSTDSPRIPDNYLQLIGTLQRGLGSPEAIRACSREELVEALMCIHAFLEQLRFTKGGVEALPAKFWHNNDDNLQRVQNTLVHLIHGSDDFAARICDVIYDPKYRIRVFGRFCALELVGTLRPHETPPINGRMAKALRYLGFDVRAT